jgi:hypothetical protein
VLVLIVYCFCPSSMMTMKMDDLDTRIHVCPCDILWKVSH